MSEPVPRGPLQQSLVRLQNVGRALRQESQQSFTPALADLQKVLATIISGVAGRPRHCPAAYVLAWEYYLVDRQQPLSARMVRYLCWEPPVATDLRFQTYLDDVVGALASRSLQGLVWCCHTYWSPAFAAGAVVQRVRRRLRAYQGDDALLTRWRHYADQLLDPSGPQRLAEMLLKERVPIPAWCHSWALDERSPYVLEVLRHALASCQAVMETDPALREYLLSTLLPWSGWPTEDFHAAMDAAIVHPITDTTPDIPERLLTLILADARLGDPRLPAQQAHWQTLSAAVRQRVVLWLASADIALFFDQIMLTSKDQEERKTFWMRYAPRVLRSRPLFEDADFDRLHPLLRQQPERFGHCGYVQGTSSALLLDFGPVVVLQLSDLSADCYVYGARSFARVLPDFWQSPPFAAEALLVPSHAALVHYDRNWEKGVAEILTLCDIRPTYKGIS